MKFLNKEILMTVQEMIKEHVEERCKYCDIQNCNGIYVTKDRETRCDRDEQNSRWNNKRI